MHQRRIEVKQDSQVRCLLLRCQQRESLYQVCAKSTPKTLEGDTGVKAAISNHELSILKSRQHYCSKMLCAVCLEQERFGQWVDCQFRAIEQQLAYLNSERRSPRLAGAHILYMTRLQPTH